MYMVIAIDPARKIFLYSVKTQTLCALEFWRSNLAVLILLLRIERKIKLFSGSKH